MSHKPMPHGKFERGKKKGDLNRKKTHDLRTRDGMTGTVRSGSSGR